MSRVLNQIIQGDTKELLKTGQFIITDHAVESFRIRIKKVDKYFAFDLIQWAVLTASTQQTFKVVQKIDKESWTARIHVEELDFITALRQTKEGNKLLITTIWESPFSNKGRLSAILNERVNVKEMVSLIDEYERNILRLEDKVQELTTQLPN